MAESIEPAWYTIGNWPLIGAISVLVITNAIGIVSIYIQSTLAHKKDLSLREMDNLREKLAGFYNPLAALCEINNQVFSSLGPHGFVEDPYRREAQAKLWNKMKEDVIIPNNYRMREILSTKTHLLSTKDNFEYYKKLLLHLAMYDAFQEMPTEEYQKYKFPEGITQHIQNKRDELVAELTSLIKMGSTKNVK